MIDTNHLGSYLNDHLAGAASAIEMLEHRLDADPQLPLHDVLDEIRSERGILRSLIDDLGASQSTAKQAAGWVAEKVSRLPREVAKTGGNAAFNSMVELEALQLGICGKRALWVMLQALTDEHSRIAELPLTDLLEQADRQVEVVESVRVATGRQTFTAREGSED